MGKDALPGAAPGAAQNSSTPTTTTRRRASKVNDQRPPTRGQSLRRVKDSREELRNRTRARGLSTGTVESPVNSSTARSFTVANVGTNGILYLKPSVRSHRRQQSPEQHFVFPSQTPQTPPDSAHVQSHDDERSRPTTPRTDHDQIPPLPHSFSPENAWKSGPAHLSNPSSRPIAHVRSRSFSTTQDGQTATTRDSVEPGTFKVVIERSPFHSRPKTADTGTIPLLEVPIPNWRLGTPRFSTHGTAILRSSVYTRASGTDDFKSTLLSPRRETHSFLSSRPRSEVYSPASVNYRTPMEPIPMQSISVPASARESKAPIGPHLYDALTANPDDRAVVRFSSSGDILAATPSRLVAHITSPSFLDYELLSDFFLTFRSFLSSRELAAYLISRLQWAVNRQDDFGRIVRVRTFVAVRHWILNYFVDDFVPLYALRAHFCDLVNALHRDLKARADGGGGDLKIVGELKKCWRRTCALYWESEDGMGKDMADEELLPGGQAASPASLHNRSSIPPIPRASTPPQQKDRAAKVETVGSNPSDQFASQHMEWARQARHTPQNSLSSPYISSQEYEGVRLPLSPESERSIPVLSCSIPIRGLGRPEPASDMPLYPHPVPNLPQPRFAASPPQSSPNRKKNRPTHSHKRSGSFSDALRDHRAPLSIPKIVDTDAAVPAMPEVPGSLIRGGLFQPGTPYIDVKNNGLSHTKSHLQLELVDSVGDDFHVRQASSPGVKKILGSVRRALSSKQPSMSTPQLPSTVHHHHMSTTNRSSNPASLTTSPGGVHKRRNVRSRTQTRIDLLASRVADSFQEAVKQQMEQEKKPQSQRSVKPDLSGFQFDFENKDAFKTKEKPISTQASQRIYSNVTSGDRSIIIMDDTGVPQLPMMSGALPSPPTTQNIVAATTLASYQQREVSIDGRISEDPIRRPPLTTLYKNSDGDISSNPRRMSGRSSSRTTVNPRRSMSAGQEQLHSFRRRGSKKFSLARSASLRRVASYNSGLSRRNTTASIATFQTMSSDNDPFFLDRHPTRPVGPARQLRRRPGGDLRAVDNVQDLEPMQRPHSTGSVSNRTHSISNSIILHSDRYVDPAKETSQSKEDNELDQPKKPISLVDTHSSQPNLRPSFEVEVAKLAALPDDIDDDGGIESALMKLEGRYEKKSPVPSPRSTIEQFTAPHGESSTLSQVPSDCDSSHIRPQTSAADLLQDPRASSETATGDNFALPRENFHHQAHDVYSAESEDSFSSIPLLNRGLSGIVNSSQWNASMQSSAKPSPLKPNSPPSWFDHPPRANSVDSPNSSTEYVVETESMRRIPRNGTLPQQSSAPRESFLLDDDEDLSDDDNSAMVARSDRTSHGVRSFFDDEPAVVESENEALPMHPLRHPPTPPVTTDLKKQTPQVNTTVFERGLPTPGLTPTSRLKNQAFGEVSQPPARSIEPAFELQPLQKVDSSPPAHLPFVLAYDSETLAQQFTVVEKDALDEIDWKELIELRWKQSSPQIRDWVEYLQTQDARGVDVVIARFNLVVKWVVSECLLTEAVEERARCIVKYIHIATHARRLRNYATMYQITIALLSTDISRLKQTWALIPAAEVQTMKSLEALVQPLRNFHNLRVEMETASVEEGCIPFIGIYTRDLIYNAQKPAFIDAAPVDGERLVNFERHHTAAMIVKSLLRLLEASSKYQFKSEPTIISKCLWMAALGDEELTALSRKYE